MKQALIVRGGWVGHTPVETSELFCEILKANDYNVEISDTLDTFLDEEKLKSKNLIIPIWTKGQISDDQSAGISRAIGSGVGLAGCHGGMCDAFRMSSDWQFMTGGQFVAHPGGKMNEYMVNFKTTTSPITQGLKDFRVQTEQYYMHVDPTVEVLATTRFPIGDGPFESCGGDLYFEDDEGTWSFELPYTTKGPHVENGVVLMPLAWTKRWGKGKVFFCSLGHTYEVFKHPTARTLMERGFLWASR